MKIEEELKNCELYLKQIKQYDPDPYYVNYFFVQYINSINHILKGIFDEANRDFGLFIQGEISQESFYEKAALKNDLNALKFSEWYSNKFNKEHENPYPIAIKKICEYKKNKQKIPEIKIMIRALERYKDDISQQIMIKTNNKKLRSKEELDIEIRRQLPIFLEVINHKRKKSNEPKVNEKQVVASAFLEIEDIGDVEIYYTSKTYIPVIKRLVGESRKKIKELSRWN